MVFVRVTKSHAIKYLALIVAFAFILPYVPAGAAMNTRAAWDERYNKLTIDIAHLEQEHQEKQGQEIQLTAAIAEMKHDVERIILIAYKDSAKTSLLGMVTERAMLEKAKGRIYLSSAAESQHNKIAEYLSLKATLVIVQEADLAGVKILNAKKDEIVQVKSFLARNTRLLRDTEDHRESFPNIPAPNPQAAAAVAFAYAQLGKPYVYATSGPATFDCSGLTAAAWSAAGVNLVHYSGAQYKETKRIGKVDLLPGDLIFYGGGGSQHVEIYVGDDKVISAPHTGTVVQVQPLRSGASGYGRVAA